MEVVHFNKEKHYEDVSTWWAKRDWPPVPLDCLSATGFVVKGYCACWVYETNASLHLLEWLVSNPDSDRNKRDLAMDKMIDHAVCYIKEGLGGKYVFSSITHDGLIKRLDEKHGFVVADKNMTNMIKVTGE